MKPIWQRPACIAGLVMALLWQTALAAAVPAKEQGAHEQGAHEQGANEQGANEQGAGTQQADTQTYATQCGACHVAFPPGDLPPRSWQLLMSGLGQHFGEDASLDAATAAAILQYLLYYAGGTEHGGTPELMLDLPDSQTPRRIVDLPAWRIHHAYLLQSGQVTLGPGPHSAANCMQCHGKFALP